LISAAKTTRLQDGDKDSLLRAYPTRVPPGKRICHRRISDSFSGCQVCFKAPRPQNEAIDFGLSHSSQKNWQRFFLGVASFLLNRRETLPWHLFRQSSLMFPNKIQDTRYVRRNKNLRPGDAFKRFAQVLTENANASEKFHGAF